MKIGILTVPFNNNYGGFLQAFALMAVLRNMGHAPYMIMRRHDKAKCSVVTKSKIIIKSAIKSLLYRDVNILLHPFEASYFIKGKNMHNFVKRCICPQTNYYYRWEDLRKKMSGQLDAIVVGSDQVWRAIYVPGIENYFLKFTEEWQIKRVAYAASFGTNTPEYTAAQIKECGNLLNLFDAVSVREKGAIDVFDRFGWKFPDVEIVLDPTLLLSQSVYDDIIKDERGETGEYLFYYMLDGTDELKSIVQKICNNRRMGMIGIADIQSTQARLPSVENWLCLIKNANIVVTDSFHGMVFSIIYNKPFVVVCNEARGADRFMSLLSLLGLSDRLCLRLNNVYDKIFTPIDWKQVNTKLDELRVASINFLKQELPNG